MHEVSLVRNIFKTLQEEFSPEEMTRLKTVKMKIGMLSNVEPLLMQSAFEAVKTDNPDYAAVELEIDLIPIQIECPDCRQKSTIEDYRFVCSACGKPTNNVVAGTELLIHQVEFLEPSS